MNIKTPSWTKVLLAWTFLTAGCLVVYLHIMSGYSGTVPIIGVMPGPPSPATNQAVGIALGICLIGIAIMSLPVLISGSWLKRTLCAVPFLLELTVLIMMMVEHCT